MLISSFPLFSSLVSITGSNTEDERNIPDEIEVTELKPPLAYGLNNALFMNTNLICAMQIMHVSYTCRHLL